MQKISLNFDSSLHNLVQIEISNNTNLVELVYRSEERLPDVITINAVEVTIADNPKLARLDLSHWYEKQAKSMRSYTVHIVDN